MEATQTQRAGYETDMSDDEWAEIEPILFPPGAPRGRGRHRDRNSARACVDAIRYLLKSGVQWSLLPKEFPPKSTVHDAFAQWTRQGVWARMNAVLREKVREGLKKSDAQRGDH